MFSPASNQTNNTDNEQICPHCGEEAPPYAFVCPNCNKNLLQGTSSSFDDFAEFEKPPLVHTLLTAAALGSLLFLAGLTLLDIQTLFGRTDLALYVRYAALVIVIVFLAFFAARGRWSKPKPVQYLITLLIVIIPIIGTLYGLFYAGRALATRRMSRVLILVLLLVVTTAAFFHYGGTEIVTDNLSYFNIVSPTTEQIAVTTEEPLKTESTAIPLPEITATLEATAASTDEEMPEETPEPTKIATPIPDLGDCVHWSDVSNEDVDAQLCVYGEFIRTFQKDEQTWVLVFSDEPGAFQIWSYPKDIAEYLPEDGSTCVMTTNWIKTTGVRPFIELRIFDQLIPCPD